MASPTARSVQHGWLQVVLLTCVLAACGGKDAPNAAPLPVITAPATGATFRAGDTLSFSGNASDAEDGALANSRLLWWADLHHDTHTHPLQAPTSGAGGTVTIPVRGEVSDNIWYRFHLRATDSAGAITEITRDIQPLKVQVTLATQPTGLALTLGGQPVVAPLTFTGVVGTERDLGAANQIFNGHNYQFSSWSDGDTASHTIFTPNSNNTYTAIFVDLGPVVNQPPTVALTAPATGTVGVAINLSATAADSDGTVTRVEFFDGATNLGQDTTAPYAFSWTPVSAGVHSLTARATDNNNGATTSVAVNVNVSAAGPDVQVPTVAITAPANFATGLTGTLVFNATASDNVGVTNVEFQVDGLPIGVPDTSSPYGVSVDTNLYASGQHVLRVRASDAAGNQSVWVSATVQFGGSRTQPAGFTRNQSFVTSLSSATAFAQAPDGRLFVAQQTGALRVATSAGVLLATPFTTLSVDSFFERGLLGVAFHPGFGVSNNFVYVYYTTASGGAHNRISRFTANGNVAVVGSEQILVDLPTLGAGNHNGGAIHFGADGKLYVGVGDNAVGSNSQSLSTPLGKMLRFNDDGTIPSDNPFFGTQTGLARAIWAYGLRNPFTFAVQPGSARIHINDVGETTWEEINLGAAGANYGWPASEGPSNIGAGVTAPLFAYRHDDASPAGSGPGGFFVGFAIAGGAFYPGSGMFPAPYRSGYFFADYVNRFVGFIDLLNGNAAYSFGSVSGEPVDMLVASDGALLVLTRSGIVRFSTP